jgi:hypothetical protein
MQTRAITRQSAAETLCVPRAHINADTLRIANRGSPAREGDACAGMLMRANTSRTLLSLDSAAEIGHVARAHGKRLLGHGPQARCLGAVRMSLAMCSQRSNRKCPRQLNPCSVPQRRFCSKRRFARRYRCLLHPPRTSQLWESQCSQREMRRRAWG